MLSTKEVAEIFDVDVWTVCNWVRLGKLPAMRDKENRRTYQFLEQDVNAFQVVWKRPTGGRKKTIDI